MSEVEKVPPHLELLILKAADRLAEAVAAAIHTKLSEYPKSAPSAEIASADTAADLNKFHLEFNFGEEFDSITKILDEKLKTFSSPTYHVPYSTDSLPDQEIIKGISSSLAVYHNLFNEVITIQHTQANVLVIDRFSKANPDKHLRYRLKVNKGRAGSYTLKVELDDFTVLLQFTKEKIVETVRALVRTIVTSNLIDD